MSTTPTRLRHDFETGAPPLETKRLGLGRLLLATSAGLGCLLSGCGLGAHSESGKTLRIWYGTDDAVERAWSQQLARRYEATHLGVRVQLLDYSFQDLNTKLQLALSAGTPPDLAYVTPRGPGIPAYVAAHSLRNLFSAARTGGWSARLRSGLLQSYNAPFAAFGAPHGAVVGVPTSLAAVAVLYNKRLLRKLNIGVPGTLAGFEMDLGRARAAGITPIGLGNGDGWLGDDWYLTLANALLPPDQLNPAQHLRTTFNFRRKPFVRAGALLQSWANQGYFNSDFGSLDAQEGVDQFFRGQTLFQLISSSQNSQIRQDALETELPIGVFGFPTTYGGRTMPLTGYEGWVVPRGARNAKAAISFINDLLSPSTAAFLSRQGVIPAHNRVALAPLQSRARSSWLGDFFEALAGSTPGVYLDAVPVSNLNATMEANVQLLLQGYETPSFLTKSLQDVYASRGNKSSGGRIDGEF